MTTRTFLSRSFTDNPQLQNFFLEGVTPTGINLGVGSYGSVVEVKYKKTACAAKQLHELLIQPGNEGVRDIIEKYQRECQLMASLQHPNITKFLGLCFMENCQLPLLVMERLHMNVDYLLEVIPNLSNPVKLSILIDTCKGLVYLHSQESPIVHRDLTARNVLLTSSLSAKIADLGNSRMVNANSSHLAQTLSKNPGTTVYMPPEALNEINCRYGPSLDIFSFGHLSLYILIQIFPGNLLPFTYADPADPEHIIGRSEIERRREYLNILQSQEEECDPLLVKSVKECLSHIPERRPSSMKLLDELLIVKSKLKENQGKSLLDKHYVSCILSTIEMKEAKEKNTKDFRIPYQFGLLTHTN